MCLRFVFLLITRMVSWLRLSQREETWKIAEILLLRHQLAVLQRRQPRRPGLDWAERALVAILLAVIPKARRQGLRLLVTPGHDRALAPRHRPPPLVCQVHPRQDRQAGHPPQNQGPCPAAGPREPRLGVPQDPRRASRPGRKDSGLDRVGNPEECRDRPCAAADRARLVTVPALSGRGDPGVRLLHGRPARRHPGLCPGRDRARHQAHPNPRGHLASHRRMDLSAGPEPVDGPRRAGAPGQVHDP
jgi:hypothetical protein